MYAQCCVNYDTVKNQWSATIGLELGKHIAYCPYDEIGKCDFDNFRLRLLISSASFYAYSALDIFVINHQ